MSESIEVRADAPLLNTTNAEVGVRFDTTRVAELPVMNSRDVFALALSAPGVSQLGSGQSVFASGTNFSSNGMRVRSNNFMIDGQDSNDPSVTGRQQPINNTDIIQEVRLITNQFAAEFGRAAGSIVNAATKSGTNMFRGSGVHLPQRRKLQLAQQSGQARGSHRSPLPRGEPVGRHARRADLPRSHVLLRVVPALDRSSARIRLHAERRADRSRPPGPPVRCGPRAQVAALLNFVPAGTANGNSESFTIGGQTFSVPLGDLTGSSSIVLNDNQFSGRIDHQLSANHRLVSRYMGNTTPDNSGSGQVTPPGLTTVVVSNRHSLNTWLNSVVGQNLSNEFRVAWSHLGTDTGAQDPSSLDIPSLEITSLGMTGFNAGATRTAIGLAVNLPQFRYNDTYQFQNNLTWIRGNHAIKAGGDVRHQYVKSFFFPTIRGLLRYANLQTFVDGVAEAANINKPLPGGEEVNYYRWWDQYYYVQDEWRVAPSLTLNLGLRYELPGNNIQSLIELSDRILGANGNNPVFSLSPVPKSDKNNFQPRVSFNWSPQTDASGLVGKLTGGDKFVLRGGYARTHDYAFLNIALNIVSSFPYVAAINRSNLADAFNVLQNTPAGVPAGTDPNQLTGPWCRRTSDRRWRISSASKCSGSSAPTWRCAWATSARSARICSRRSTAIRGCRSAGRAARGWTRRAA